MIKNGLLVRIFWNITYNFGLKKNIKEISATLEKNSCDAKSNTNLKRFEILKKSVSFAKYS